MSSGAHDPDLSATLNQAQRDALLPAQVLVALKQGNERFRNGARRPRDFVAQQRATASGQYPAAVILGCVDSRVPAEIILDVGIGDTFIARVAGNVIDSDMLGSAEFACAVSGAKLVVVLGHTACGAIEGAIAGVNIGNLAGLLARIKPAVAATKFAGDRSKPNPDYVNAVARTNVLLGVENIRRGSPILAEMEKKGEILIVGAMYDLHTGVVDFLG